MKSALISMITGTRNLRRNYANASVFGNASTLYTPMSELHSAELRRVNGAAESPLPKGGWAAAVVL
jgi:hypothetical protein